MPAVKLVGSKTGSTSPGVPSTAQRHQDRKKTSPITYAVTILPLLLLLLMQLLLMLLAPPPLFLAILILRTSFIKIQGCGIVVLTSKIDKPRSLAGRPQHPRPLIRILVKQFAVGSVVFRGLDPVPWYYARKGHSDTRGSIQPPGTGPSC